MYVQYSSLLRAFLLALLFTSKRHATFGDGETQRVSAAAL